MKKLLTLIILCFILFLSISLSSWGGVTIIGGGIDSGGGGSPGSDSCVGGDGLLFSWHFENLDVTLGGVYEGVNNGCSVGDTTATANSSAVLVGTPPDPIDGTYIGSHPTSSDYFSFSLSSDDIFNYVKGTIDIWVNVNTHVNGAGLLGHPYSSSNAVQLIIATVSTFRQFKMVHTAGSTTRSATTTFSDPGYTLDTWYHIIAKWDYTVHGTYYVEICADTTTGTTNCGYNTNALGTWGGAPTSFRIGEMNALSSVFYLDNLKVYGSWQ